MRRKPQPRGFSLVELIVVILVLGILAAVLAPILRSSLEAFFDTRRRAELTDIADTALRMISRDIRRAVPNSYRLDSPTTPTCLEFVPIKTGGAFRKYPDTAPSRPGSDPLALTGDTSFDVVSYFSYLNQRSPVPEVGDDVVIGNLTADDVFSSMQPGKTRARVKNRTIPPPPLMLYGTSKIELWYDAEHSPNQPVSFPASTVSRRFFVVDQKERVVFYRCDAVGESNGNGTGTLQRRVRDNYSDPICTGTAEVLAKHVSKCNVGFISSSSAQFGYIWLELELLQAGERVRLFTTVQVSNVP